ncbi:MAG: single-stranded DNA-binding protein [Candidatus Saccharibacteria bacterium]|nr:single-stranded DNA-binding protein [Candidatus Saccharibacteria bacterium]
MERAEIVALSKQYLEDVLTFFDLNIEVEVVIEDEVVVVRVPSTERNSLLIGKNAETLRSLQHLLASMLRNKNTSVHRVNVDIADYKKQHAEKIAEKARGWIEEVRRTGERKTIELNAADRWVVHHVASEYDDIETHSEGEGRARRLVMGLR